MNHKMTLIKENLSYFQVIVYKSIPQRYHYLSQDFAQDAILKTINKIDQYDETKGNFKSWIFKLTQNLCFDAIRKMDKIKTTPLNLNAVIADKPIIRNNIDRMKIREALNELPKKDRELIILKFYFNCSGKEISKFTCIPEKQVAVFYQRAKVKLKKQYLAIV